MELTLSKREASLVLAALRNWQEETQTVDLADFYEAYFEEHDLPRHPLEAQGFLSVGCQPCTSPVLPGEDPRAGRWRGWDKTECGIHVLGAPDSDDGELPAGYEPAF